eukprot:Skav230298  [mRNA]  locus=scaffold2934:180046:185070:- [translate_table: standard]
MMPQVPWQALPTLDDGLERAARAEYELGVQAWNLRQAEQGLELFLKSAQKGHEVGEYCFRFGMYHELPPSDMQQAFRWYKRGARMNHRASTTMLGKLHMAAGHWEEAMRFLQRTGLPHTERLGIDESFRSEDLAGKGYGGERGDSLAQWFLGELFLQSAKLRHAVKWWKRSAENGDSDAMMRLSQVFRDGAIGVPQELVMEWWKPKGLGAQKKDLKGLAFKVGPELETKQQSTRLNAYAEALKLSDSAMVHHEEARMERRAAQHAARQEAERRRRQQRAGATVNGDVLRA